MYLRFYGDLDVGIQAETAEGLNLAGVVESKARLSAGDVHKFASRMESDGFQAKLTEAGLPGPYRVYLFGIRVDRAAERMARKLGVGLLKPSGEQFPPEGKFAGTAGG